MYTTKSFCPKNSKDFLSNSPYQRPKETNGRYKNPQFQTQPSKKGQTQGYFTKLTYSSHPYSVGTRYLDTQPRDERKFGFASKDAFRRDEFTSDIRARQWREKLKTEMDFVRKNVLSSADSQEDVWAESTPEGKRRAYEEKNKEARLFQTQVPWGLYDIGRSVNTPICNKCSRETFYCTHRVAAAKARRPGTAPTSYETYGNFEDHKVTKPKYGNINELKYFADSSHLVCGEP
jgi:hypothetical protein